MSEDRTLKDTAAAMTLILEESLKMPEAWEDHPWGETVVKVRKKIFVFLNGSKEGVCALSVKLPRSAEFALLHPFASKTGYGLGNSGWVTCEFNDGDDIPVDLLLEWVEQSYRAVAPKKLAALVPET